MLDERLHALEEAHRVGQGGMELDGRLVPPARVDVEEPRIAEQPKSVHAETSRLLSRGADDLHQRLGHLGLEARTGVKSREDVQLPRVPRLSCTPILVRGRVAEIQFCARA